MSMKSFSLDEFLADRKREVVTRDGLPVLIKNVYFSNPSYPVEAAIKTAINNYQTSNFTANGLYEIGKETKYDLFFATEKREGWINVFKYNFGEPFIGDMHIFRSKEEAEESAKNDRTYVKSIKIEWEE